MQCRFEPNVPEKCLVVGLKHYSYKLFLAIFVGLILWKWT
jgi:hypothetical protein